MIATLLLALFLQAPTATIAWENPNLQPVWFNVYRSTSPLGPWVKINPERIGYFTPTLEYTDPAALTGTSYYTVTAEDQNGESDKSEVVTVNISSRPQRPTNPRRK